MKVIRVRPSSQQIKRVLINCHETLYLEGIDGLSRSEISQYHNKSIKRNLRDYDFVILSNDDGSYTGMAMFHNSEWDTKYLRQNIAKIDYIFTAKNASDREDIYNKLLEEVFSICRYKKIKLIFCRNSINNKALHQCLIQTGANPISVLVNLYYPFEEKGAWKKYSEKYDIEIRRPKNFEYSKVVDFMAGEYRNRLLNEPFFKEGDVKNLYREWAKNDLKGHVKEVLIAVAKGRIAGFVAFDKLRINNKEFGFVDVIVVDKSFRKEGIGTALMSELAICLYKDTEGIFLGTELENAEALSFYKRLGFHIAGFYYTYHIKLNNRIFKC